jgi:hypothetical protein
VLTNDVHRLLALLHVLELAKYHLVEEDPRAESDKTAVSICATRQQSVFP